MTFGQLTKWFASLGDRRIRQSISQNYGMDESILVSALQYLTRVRNICAHHDRLWDLNVATGLKIPNTLGNDLEAAKAFNKQALGKVYNAIVLNTHLMEVITPNGDWPERLLELKGGNTSVPEADMGFPASTGRTIPSGEGIFRPASERLTPVGHVAAGWQASQQRYHGSEESGHGVPARPPTSPLKGFLPEIDVSSYFLDV